MKDSRDSHTLSQEQIDQHVDVCAWMKPTHITIDCFMDWPEYCAKWVDSIRRYNIPIIFRLKWYQWDFQETLFTADDYIDNTKQFIIDNLDLFQDGDIFDCCAEMEVSIYWEQNYDTSWPLKTPFVNAYNEMLGQLLIEIPKIFIAANKNIIANHCSHTPGSFINNLISEENAIAHEWITCDSYPESDHDNIVDSIAARRAEIEQLHNKYPTKNIFITEAGYDLHGCSDQEQKDVITAMFEVFSSYTYVMGACYWVVCDYEQTVGVIHRASTSNTWRARLAAPVLASLVANKGKVGRVPITS